MEDFYKVVSSDREGEVFRWKVALQPSSIIYKAHFPGHPITPGACQIELLRAFASAGLGKNVTISEVRSVKFLKIIDPSVTDSLSVEGSFKNQDDGTLRCDANILSAEGIVTKASIILKDGQVI